MLHVKCTALGICTRPKTWSFVLTNSDSTFPGRHIWCCIFWSFVCSATGSSAFWFSLTVHVDEVLMQKFKYIFCYMRIFCFTCSRFFRWITEQDPGNKSNYSYIDLTYINDFTCHIVNSTAFRNNSFTFHLCFFYLILLYKTLLKTSGHFELWRCCVRRWKCCYGKDRSW